MHSSLKQNIHIFAPLPILATFMEIVSKGDTL
jgi:hypothetical protein